MQETGYASQNARLHSSDALQQISNALPPSQRSHPADPSWPETQQQSSAVQPKASGLLSELSALKADNKHLSAQSSELSAQLEAAQANILKAQADNEAVARHRADSASEACQLQAQVSAISFQGSAAVRLSVAGKLDCQIDLSRVHSAFELALYQQ